MRRLCWASIAAAFGSDRAVAVGTCSWCADRPPPASRRAHCDPAAPAERDLVAGDARFSRGGAVDYPRPWSTRMQLARQRLRARSVRRRSKRRRQPGQQAAAGVQTSGLRHLHQRFDRSLLDAAELSAIPCPVMPAPADWMRNCIGVAMPLRRWGRADQPDPPAGHGRPAYRQRIASVAAGSAMPTPCTRNTVRSASGADRPGRWPLRCRRHHTASRRSRFAP